MLLGVFVIASFHAVLEATQAFDDEVPSRHLPFDDRQAGPKLSFWAGFVCI